MRRIFVIFFVLMITATLQAQKANSLVYYVNTGVAFPSSPDLFSDAWSTGFNFGGGLGKMINKTVELQGYFTYHNFSFDEDGLLSSLGASGVSLSVDGASASIITALANIKLRLQSNPEQKVTPYFGGGAGFFRISLGDASVSGPGGSIEVGGGSESAIGLAFGAGVDIQLSPRTALFFDGKYSIGFTDVESIQYFPVKVGLQFN